MALYDFVCTTCGELIEDCFIWNGTSYPRCCNRPMTIKYSADKLIVKEGMELYIGRMEEIHKAQEQRGERLRQIHPSEVVR